MTAVKGRSMAARRWFGRVCECGVPRGESCEMRAASCYGLTVREGARRDGERRKERPAQSNLARATPLHD
jgi:hypothetical protein